MKIENNNIKETLKYIEENLEKSLGFPVSFLYNWAGRENHIHRSHKNLKDLHSILISVDLSELNSSYLRSVALDFSETSYSNYWRFIMSSTTKKQASGLFPWGRTYSSTYLSLSDRKKALETIIDIILSGVLSLSFVCSILIRPGDEFYKTEVDGINNLLNKEKIGLDYNPSILFNISDRGNLSDLPTTSPIFFIELEKPIISRVVEVISFLFNGRFYDNIKTIYSITMNISGGRDSELDSEEYFIKPENFKNVLTRIFNRDSELLGCWDYFANYLVQRFV